MSNVTALCGSFANLDVVQIAQEDLQHYRRGISLTWDVIYGIPLVCAVTLPERTHAFSLEFHRTFQQAANTGF